MKTQSASIQKWFLPVIVLICVVSCKKESVATLNNNQNVSASSVDNTYKNGVINLLAGSYSVKGTRTLYIGKASDSVVNLVVDLSAYSPKIVTALNATTLVCDYADLGYASNFQLGWQYVITFYPAKQSFDVQPNDIMNSQIVPGSWVVFNKYFNPENRRFYFKTGYANGSSGYDRIVEETLTWKTR